MPMPHDAPTPTPTAPMGLLEWLSLVLFTLHLARIGIPADLSGLEVAGMIAVMYLWLPLLEGLTRALRRVIGPRG